MRVQRLRGTIAGLMLAALVGGGAARAEIRLPKMLSAHAVLQREKPIHIWGWSGPGECVQVSFHAQHLQTCANPLGMWSTYLSPEPAGGPYVLTVAGGGNDAAKLSVDDLLVGDVWFASGQSNMEMPLKGFGPDTPIKDSAKEIAAANTIIWNGPMGVFEKPPFDKGTVALAHAVAGSHAISVVGGGDSEKAIKSAGVSDKISHISTGGGASLDFLSGVKLPGVEALTSA